MIANAAFLAALTTFVLAGVAGRRIELSGTLQGRHLPHLRRAHRRRRRARVPQPVGASTSWRGGCFSGTPAGSSRTSIASSGVPPACMTTSGAISRRSRGEPCRL